MFKELSTVEKEKLWKEVSEFITEERKELYDRILKFRTRHFTIALEDIYQEHNAGALARTAECYGVQDVYVMKNHNEFRIAKGMAKGAEQWLDFYKFDGDNNIQDCIDSIKSKGYQVVATSPHAKASQLADFNIENKSAFFFGTEKNGLHQSIVDQADELLHVPIYGVTESFNVSITAAVIMHDLSKRLHESDLDWQLSHDEQLTKRLEWAYTTIRKSKILYGAFMRDINPSIAWHL